MWGTTNLPYVRHEPSNADNQDEYVGGTVVRFKAGAALNVGDVVYISAANTVNKSATTADYAAFAGVVVGGTDTAFDCISNDSDVGIAACSASGEYVLVQVTGLAWVKAAAATAVAKTVGVVTTAGQVDDSTATAGAYVGTSVTAATNPGDAILMLIAHR